MSYDHSMNLTARLKEGITREQVAEALEPLRDYMGWSKEEVLQGESLTGDDEIHWEMLGPPGDDRLTLSIYTSGETGNGLYEILAKTAKNLSGLVEATYFEHRDHDTGDLENAISRIWVGSDEEINEAQRAKAREDAIDVLRAGGYNETELSLAIAFLKDLNCEAPKDAPRPTKMRPS